MSGAAAIEVDEALLRGWPLPRPDGNGDKESRGRVLVVAGSREMPGAALLAGTAALRAGAGKLTLATAASVAPMIALAMPEARVIALPEAAGGGLLEEGAGLLEALAGATAALLAGPGLVDPDSSLPLVRRLLPLFADATIVLDALAMDVVRAQPALPQAVVMTPHAGEMAHLTGLEKDAIRQRPLELALRQAAQWGAVVALKGAVTHIADPLHGRAWRHASRTPGLGTSGSGDVLAGLIAGLAARGATPAQAAVWGVTLHARAGDRMAERTGRLGYLARELAGEVPALMDALAGS
ncbi:MAG TPA: NAD(P)H-hydrate dehydratase [Ramlibacter sp.]|nr:NAD(P)H-hydrate dehydratase [Ramlibacter sp.]